MNWKDRKQIGSNAEELACEHLRREGYRILDRNWRHHNWGELDIVASEGGEVVIVEVRSIAKGLAHPSELVSLSKLRRLRLLAELWMHKIDPELLKACRIDLIAVIYNKSPAVAVLEWFKRIA